MCCRRQTLLQELHAAHQKLLRLQLLVEWSLKVCSNT